MVSRRTILGGLALAMPGVTALASDNAYSIAPMPIADGIWMVAGTDAAILPANGGAIANIAIIDTPAGTVLVDSGPSLRYGQALKVAAQTLTGKPVIRVYVTHLHPDHGMGIAAFDPAVVAALPGTIADMKRDGRGFSDALYRLLGDWMRGTEIVLPGIAIASADETFGGRQLRLMALSGHSSADLALLDERTGLLVGGDLVFHNRAPSTPTADLARWRESLATLAQVPHKAVLPGHGPFDATGTAAIAQTRDWIDWLDTTLRDAVRAGLDMVEAGELPIPPRFAGMAAARYELQRSVSHLFPALEASLLPRVDGG
jgi:quinoprotein relay system zinc metallohydrolase 1